MLGDNIKNIRKSKGLTQEELANELHVVRQTVSKWEKNLSVPDADLLEKIAIALETDVQTLLGNHCITIGSKNEVQNDDLSLQPLKLNEQISVKNRFTRKIWKIVSISLIALTALCLLWFFFGKTTTITESTTDVFTKALP